MKRSRVTLLLGAGALAAAAAVAILVVTHGRSESPARIDAHRLTKDVSPQELRRVLEAAEAVDTTTPNAELIADGKRLFREPALYQDGLSCQSCRCSSISADLRVSGRSAKLRRSTMSFGCAAASIRQ